MIVVPQQCSTLFTERTRWILDSWDRLPSIFGIMLAHYVATVVKYYIYMQYVYSTCCTVQITVTYNSSCNPYGTVCAVLDLSETFW